MAEQGVRAISDENEERLEQKMSVKKLWNKLGLDAHTLRMMFKGACPTFMAIALYQCTEVAHAFGAVGYVAAIVAQISMCIRPRAIFVEGAIIDVLGTFLAVSMSLLASWCVIKAREHTSARGALSDYNSSACVVSAIWVMFNVWMASTFRAFRPQYRLNVIHYLIFTEITIVQSAVLPTMSAVIALELLFLKIFFVGFGLAMASNLLIFPNSCRMMVFDDIAMYLGALLATIRAESAYVAALDGSEMLTAQVKSNGDCQSPSSSAFNEKSYKDHDFLWDVAVEAESLRQARLAMMQVHGKLFGDLELAKKEVAWGKLGPHDLDSMYQHLRLLVRPVGGLASLPAIFDHFIRSRHTDWKSEGKKYSPGAPEPTQSFIEQEVWRDIFQSLQTPLSELGNFTSDAISHVGIVLELSHPSADKHVQDVEARETSCPGQPAFAESLRQRAREHSSNKGFLFKKWRHVKRLEVSGLTEQSDGQKESSKLSQQDHEQLLLVLYLQHLVHATYYSLIDMVDFAEGKARNGSMKKNHLIVPGKRRIMKWLRGLLSEEHAGQHREAQEEVNPSSSLKAIGDSFGKYRDPEHLPPRNALQKFGDDLRTLGHFLGSSQSAFGARSAAAVISIAIVGYLRPTQNFFFEERCLWAMIIIAIGMNPTSGSSISNFIMRLIGTAVAVGIAIVNWYVADGKTSGVLIFLFLFNFMEMYGIIKYPRFTGIFMVTIITRMLVVGYALEVNKVGIESIESQNQPYHPVYLIGPYRLAAVAAGSFSSFFWTIFPYPITSRSVLRKNLGHSIFLLTAYYSCMHSTVEVWMAGVAGNPKDKSSPGRRLDKVRKRIYAKQMMILSSIREHSSFLGWEPTIGGKFPAKLYNRIVSEVESVLDCFVLMAYAATESSNTDNDRHGSLWLDHLSHQSSSIDFTSHDITSLLSLLSASVTMGQPLPPYLRPPKPYGLLTRLKKTDPGQLSLEHAEDLGYSAFSVMEINSALMSDGLGRLVNYVRELVGDVEFKFVDHLTKDEEGKKVEKRE